MDVVVGVVDDKDVVEGAIFLSLIPVTVTR